jgi:putative Mg2+ transporter-C (MgtC) family protein
MNLLELAASKDVTIAAAVLRLGMAVLAGGFIGLEREIRRQAAGLRTHILICLGSCLLMILSIWLPQSFGLEQGDPGRIAAQVVSGIGFLGAGAFIKVGNNVKGLTTAASIWVVAAIGLAIGAGMYGPAAFALGAALLVLTALDHVERRFFPADRMKLLQIWYDESTADRKLIGQVLEGHKISLHSVDAFQSVTKKQTRINMLVRVPLDADIEKLFKELRGTGKVVKIKVMEKY